MADNIFQNELFKKYLLDDGDKFFYFISNAFDNVAGGATLEELAVFAFGSIEEAVEAYQEANDYR